MLGKLVLITFSPKNIYNFQNRGNFLSFEEKKLNTVAIIAYNYTQIYFR